MIAARFTACVALVALGSCGIAPLFSSPSGQSATVARWVDGDTLHVTVDGKDVTVRLPDIDAPEYQHHGGRISSECVDKAGAALATARVKVLAPVGSTVRLRGDDTDRYGRQLAVVVNADGVDVGGRLVDEGLARQWPDGPCPTKGDVK